MWEGLVSVIWKLIGIQLQKSEDGVWQLSISIEKWLQRVSWSRNSFTYKRIMKSSLAHINFSDVLHGETFGIPKLANNNFIVQSLPFLGEPTRNPSHLWVWSEFVAEKMKCCYFQLARKLKGSLLKGAEVGGGVGCDNDSGVNTRWCWERGLITTMRVHFCQIFKEGQPIRDVEGWCLHLPFSCHWLIWCISVGCISLQRFLFRLTLITAGEKL